jgi:hypothetical protein
MAQILRQLGLISLNMGEAKSAENLLQQSASYSREIGDRTLMARALIGLGIVKKVEENLSESRKHLLEAFACSILPLIQEEGIV